MQANKIPAFPLAALATACLMFTDNWFISCLGCALFAIAAAALGTRDRLFSVAFYLAAALIVLRLLAAAGVLAGDIGAAVYAVCDNFLLAALGAAFLLGMENICRSEGKDIRGLRVLLVLRSAFYILWMLCVLFAPQLNEWVSALSVQYLPTLIFLSDAVMLLAFVHMQQKPVFAFPLAALGMILLLVSGSYWLLLYAGYVLVSIAAMLLLPRGRAFSAAFYLAAGLMAVQRLALAALSADEAGAAVYNIFSLLWLAAVSTAFLLGIAAFRRAEGENALVLYLLLVFCGAAYTLQILFGLGVPLGGAVSSYLPTAVNLAKIAMILVFLMAQRDFLQVETRA